MRSNSRELNRFQAYIKLFPLVCIRDHQDYLSLGNRNYISVILVINSSETEFSASRRTSRCAYQICMGTKEIWYIRLERAQSKRWNLLKFRKPHQHKNIVAPITFNVSTAFWIHSYHYWDDPSTSFLKLIRHGYSSASLNLIPQSVFSLIIIIIHHGTMPFFVKLRAQIRNAIARPLGAKSLEINLSQRA